jgi:Flp pilus assembly protein TadG
VDTPHLSLARWFRAALARLLPRDRRGVVVPIVIAAVPAFIGGAALAVDAGFFYVQEQRLQAASDAAAMGASHLLSLSPTTAQLQAAAYQAAVDASGGQIVGAIQTPVSVSATSSSVSVTLTSKTQDFFAGVLNVVAPTLSASSVAGSGSGGSGGSASGCVLALDKTIANAIQVDNMGTISASGCGVFSNSSATSAIYLNSGTIKGSSIGAVGTVTKSNSGSNTWSPTPANNQASETDPNASLTLPAYGACNYTNASFTAWQATPYAFTQAKNVFCGNTTIGGNGTTDTFAPGIYYVVNGSLTFNNANVTSATGVTFVLTGTNPGSFSWTNYSGTYSMSAPSSGSTKGILVWMACGTNQTFSMQGGSTMSVSGSIYAPCAHADIGNNAQLVTASGGAMNFVMDSMYIHGSGGIYPSGTTATASPATIALTQ